MKKAHLSQSLWIHKIHYSCFIQAVARVSQKVCSIAVRAIFWYAQMTMEWVFDIKDFDNFWCTADVGWITGHTYLIYGPLACGATTIIYEGTLAYPNYGRWWQMIEEYMVNKF